ncbi:hypothetical protein ABK040_011079 [Willaertia magna]
MQSKSAKRTKDTEVKTPTKKTKQENHSEISSLQIDETFPLLETILPKGDKTDNYEYILADTIGTTNKTISYLNKWKERLNLGVMNEVSFWKAIISVMEQPPFENLNEFKERITKVFQCKSVEIEEETVFNFKQITLIEEVAARTNVNILIGPDFINTFNSQIHDQLIIRCFYKKLQSGDSNISICKLYLSSDMNVTALIEDLNLSLSIDKLQSNVKNPPKQTQQPLGSSSSSNSDNSGKFLSVNSTLFEQLQELHLRCEDVLEKELLRFGLYNIKIQQRFKDSDRFCYYAHCSSIYKEEDKVFLKLSMGRLENVSLMEKIVKENIRHTNISTIFRYGVISHKTLFENPYLNLLKVISFNDFSKLEINCNDNLQYDIYYTIQEPLVKKEQYQNEIKKKEVKTMMVLLIKLFYDCLFGINFLNNLNIMHCDLSMQNILFRKSDLNDTQGYYHGKLLKVLKNLTDDKLVIYHAVLIDH